MANPWLAAARVSGVTPTSVSTAGSSSPSLLLPPDPPDPSHPLNISNFPLLSSPSSPSSPSQDSSLTAYVEPENVVLALPAHHVCRPVVVKTNPNLFSNLLKEAVAVNPRSRLSTVSNSSRIAFVADSPSKGLISLPSTQVPLVAGESGDTPPAFAIETTLDRTIGTKPTLTTPATRTPSQNVPSKPVSPPSQSVPGSTIPVRNSMPLSPTHFNPPPVNDATKTWAQKLKSDVDRTLTRLAPLAYSPEGIPRVAIPDSVFQEGANLHKDFIICRFKGRPPTFKHVQNVLSHMWGRGQRLEIHMNPINRSMLVRIPNAFIRNKVLEKKLWYIGECMFLVSQWDSTGGASEDLDAIPIWAHLKGMPFDLMYDKGISLVAGLVGEPKETDEFTKNLVSLIVAHVKVEVNLNKPLPSSVEVLRQDGSILIVNVEYPWVPPTCSNCKELGHVIRYCHYLPPPSVPARSEVPRKETGKAPASPGPSTSNIVPPQAENPPVASNVLSPETETISKQHMTCHVTIPGHQSFYYTAVYASNLSVEIADLWCDLIEVQHNLSLDACPWIVCGDFNQIIHPMEHSAIEVNHLTTDMMEMRDCLMQLELYDLRYQGPTFTWTNKQPANPVAKKLDRLLVNNHWLSSYLDSVASFLPPDFSDHAPCLLNLASPLPLAGTKPFKFINFLAKHPSFLPLIEAAWSLAGNTYHHESSLSVLCASAH
ncbi:unnamed protein product [Thlaspi arvense]|uniref:DUF4283 domain-containing protein n=1 Tax=Thlaspi arvense TaxID=13288 RepID=A0AAU9RPM5_THLAR|nr:unnamed protein product [Thlaspi arvense]